MTSLTFAARYEAVRSAATRMPFLQRLAWIVVVSFIALYFLVSFSWTPYIHDENYLYLPYYWSSHSAPTVWAKFFDVCRVESCLSRFRPVGHFFEWLDAKIVLASFRSGIPLGFRSLVQLIATYGMFFVFTRIARNLLPRWPSAFRWMICTLFILSPPVLVSNASYFRPAKTVAALFATILFWFATREDEEHPSWLSRILTTVFFCLMLFVDEQAAFFLFVFASWGILRGLENYRKHRPLPSWLAPALIALFVFPLGVFVLGPISYQVFSTGALIPNYSNPSDFLVLHFSIVVRALKLFLFSLSSLLGAGPDTHGVPLIIAAIVLFGTVLRKDASLGAAPSPRPRSWSRPLLVPILYLAFLALSYILLLRHPPIGDYDVRRSGYYFLPISAVFFGTFLLASSRLATLSPRREQAILLVAILLGVANTMGAVKARESFLSGIHCINRAESNYLMTKARFETAPTYPLSRDAASFLRAFKSELDAK